MSVLTEVPQNKQSPEQCPAGLWNKIQDTWFLCNYCHRAFLNLNQLLTHKTVTHKKQFYSDKGIDTCERRKSTRHGRAASGEDARKADSEAGENDSTDPSSVRIEVGEVISSDDQTTLETDPEDDTLETKITNIIQRLNDDDDGPTSPSKTAKIMNSGKGMNDASAKERDPAQQDILKKFKIAFKQASSKKQKCRFCSQRFPTKCNLKLHELVFHNKRKVKGLSCKYCHKISLDDSLHAIHEKSCSKIDTEGMSTTVAYVSSN